MNPRAEPKEKKEPFQFTLAELLNFVFITCLGLMLLTPTNRPEIELTNCLIMILSAVLGALIGIFSSRARTSRRIIFMISGVMFGWLLTYYLATSLAPPRYPEVSDRGRDLANRGGIRFEIQIINRIYQKTDPNLIDKDYTSIFNPDSNWVPTQ